MLDWQGSLFHRYSSSLHLAVTSSSKGQQGVGNLDNVSWNKSLNLFVMQFEDSLDAT